MHPCSSTRRASFRDEPPAHPLGHLHHRRRSPSSRRRQWRSTSGRAEQRDRQDEPRRASWRRAIAVPVPLRPALLISWNRPGNLSEFGARRETSPIVAAAQAGSLDVSGIRNGLTSLCLSRSLEVGLVFVARGARSRARARSRLLSVSTGEHGRVRARAAIGEKRPAYNPSYSQRASHVSNTVTRATDGMLGFIRSHTHRARFSLVGFSSPGTSFR